MITERKKNCITQLKIKISLSVKGITLTFYISKFLNVYYTAIFGLIKYIQSIENK